MLVAKLDSQNLNNELHGTLWSLIQKNSPVTASLELKRLLFDSLIFYLSALTTKTNGVTTYGSSLTGVSFQTTKGRLFFANYLLPRIIQELQRRALSNSKTIILLATFLDALAALWSTQTLLQFLSTDKGYLSLPHKLLRIKPSMDTPSSFYTSSVTSTINFQSTQLLYNAALQFLATQLLRSSILAKFLKKTPRLRKGQNSEHIICPNCEHTPTTPYTTTCCSANYCYICILKTIKTKRCQRCNSTNIKGRPKYANKARKD
ncbi:LAFA_0G03180g1_1 [Lachancea sp. 'fantastica']|nr:LAFA_0G03180g1_1 [Lachancea sp. 'fantastica']